MRERLTNNIALKIISVLCAIAVWIIVLNINDPNKVVSVSKIPVEIINDDAITSLNKAYSIESGKTCTITISGPRSIIDKLDEEDFTAVADIKNLSLTNSVPIEVELKKNNYKSKVDIEVKTILKLEIEDIIDKEYEINVTYKGNTNAGFVVTDTQLETKTVVITAPRSQMEKIRSVVATVNVTNRSEDFTDNAIISLLDINGREIKLDDKQITLSFNRVNATTTVLYKKDLAVVYELPESIDYDTLITGHEVSSGVITVVGKKEVLDTMDSVVLPVNLDEYENTDTDIALTFAINDILPENVYNYSSMEEIVLNIYINKQEERTFTTKAKNISISNIPDGLEASLVTKGDISYTVRGLKETIEALKADDIELKVDVGELTEGTHSLLVTFILPDGISLLNDVYVDVSLASKEETSTSEQDSSDESSENTTTKLENDTSESTAPTTTPQESDDTETSSETTNSTTESESEEETTEEETTSPIQEET